MPPLTLPCLKPKTLEIGTRVFLISRGGWTLTRHGRQPCAACPKPRSPGRLVKQCPKPRSPCRLVKQDVWARQQASENGGSSDFWAAAGLVLDQLDGLVAGYDARSAAEHAADGGRGAAAVPPLTRADLLLVSGVGGALL